MTNFIKRLITTREFRVENPESFKNELERIGLDEAGKDIHPESEVDEIDPAAGFIDYEGLRGFRYAEEGDGRFWLGGYDPMYGELRPDPGFDPPEENMVKEAAETVRDHIKEGETAVFKLVSHRTLKQVRAHVIVVNHYGVESMTMEEAENMIRKRMNPLRQGVKRATS